jgi:hypothetical protein
LVKKYSIILSVLLISIGLYQKINLINTQKTQVDELYVLARACNHSAYSLSPAFSLDKKEIYSLSQLMKIFNPKFVDNNFFENVIYYLRTYPNLSNHPPLPDVLTKLTTWDGTTNIKRLRYLSLIYFFITLPFLYLLYRKLGVSRNNSFWSVAIFSALSLASLVFVFPKNYALWILSSTLCLICFINFLKEKTFLNFLLAFLSFHAVFQVHYFSAMILPAIFILLIYKSKKRLSPWLFYIAFFALSLAIYYPIIKLQKSFTSKYFDSFDSYLPELKSFLKTFVTIFGLNFKSVIGILIMILIFILFVRKFNPNKLFFLILTLCPSFVVLLYDCVLGHNMVGNFRYSTLSLIFLPVFLSKIFRNKFLIVGFLVLNVLLPQLTKIQYLNSSNFIYPSSMMKALAQKSQNQKILVCIDSYSIYNILFLYELNVLKPNSDNISIACLKYVKSLDINSFDNVLRLKYFKKDSSFKILSIKSSAAH